MLPKKSRLNVAVSLLQKPLHQHHGRFFLYKYYNSKKDTPRYAVVVGKKVLKSAAKRNELRRAGYRAIQNCEGRQAEYDVILLAKKAPESDEEKRGMIDEITTTLCSKQSS